VKGYWILQHARLYLRWLVFGLVTAVISGAPAPAQIPEYRAQWADAFHAGYLSSSQVNTSLAHMRTANGNVFIPEVRVYSDAYYIPRAAHYTSYGSAATIYSYGVPMTMDLNSEPEPRKNTSFDALGDVIAKAHATAEPIEVWAWLVSFRTGAVMRNNHPEWLTRNSADEDQTLDFDPGHPGVAQQLVNVSMDIVSNYDVDGLNFDYIRFSNSAWGYNPVSVARFNARYGRSGLPSNTDALWKQWRRDQVTNLMRKIFLNVIAVRPDVRISADTITWAPGPNRPSPSDPNPLATWKSNFQATSSAYNSVYQDWRSWMEEGIIDVAIPMNYFRECTHMSDYDKWSDFTKENQFGRQGMIGPGTYLNTLEGALDQLSRSRDPSAPNGILGTGQAVYSYASPYNQECSSSNSDTIVNDPAGMAAALSSGIPTRPTPLNPTPAPLPELPRLTNGKGHLMGTITRFGSPAPGWIDGATVTITGPATRTARTDGTGFYGFVDLPPGQYSLTAGAQGVMNVSGNVTIAAHTVKKQDLLLRPGVNPSRLTFSVSPSGSLAGVPFTSQPVVQVLDTEGGLATSYQGNVTLAIKAGSGASGASLLGSATVPVVNGAASFSDLAIDLTGAGYVLVASSGSLTTAESAAFDVLRVPLATDTFRRVTALPHATDGTAWSLSGLGVNRNPDSPYYGYAYLTNRLSGQNRVQIIRPEPSGMGTAAEQYADTGRYIQMGDNGLTPWDAAVGPDDTVWVSDLGNRRVYSAPAVPPGIQTSVSPTLQMDLSSISATGGPRGLSVTGPVTDARLNIAWFTDSRAQRLNVSAPDPTQPGSSETVWSKTLGFISGPYGVGVDTAGNAYYPKSLTVGSTASAFLKIGPDGVEQAFDAVIPAWAIGAAGTSLQDAAFVADAAAPGGGYLYYSARVTVGGANKVIVHRFGLDGAWLDGFGPAIAGAPEAYTPIEIPASTVSTVAYIDADDRGNVYVLGMDGGANAVIKVARSVPYGLEDAGRALQVGAGLSEAAAWDLPRLDVAGPDGIDLADAVALARRAAGLGN